MDNYYTSPEVVVALAERRVYIRGDMQSKQGRFSTAAIQSNGSNRDRGTHKMVSDKNMVLLYGGLMATRFIFLTADGTVANEVTRRIGRQERKVQAQFASNDTTKECNSGPA
jgi:hypothetical protein